MVKINDKEYIGVMEDKGKFFCNINICNSFFPEFLPIAIVSYNTVELEYNLE